MAIIGRVKVGQTNRTTIVSSNFKPKPNLALTELTDTSLTGIQDGQVLQFNSTTGKFEANTVIATIDSINGGFF